MGVLIEGVWRDEELPQEVGRASEFRRAESRYRDCITADGSSGFKAEAGRYHLYVAHGCPWAHRILIYRALKKLDGLISVAYAIPGLKKSGWTFENDPAYPDCTPDSARTGSLNIADALQQQRKCELYALGNSIVYTGGRPPMPPTPWLRHDPATTRPLTSR